MIDQIILSSNEDPTYFEFWKPVSLAYNWMYPGARVHLALLSDRAEEDPVVQECRQYGLVTLFRPMKSVSEFAQAKMIRLLLASQQGDDVCYVDDIDLLPLSRSFIDSKVSKRPKNTLLCVGGEVYGHNGCYPMSQMTAEGHVWKRFINPRNLCYERLFAEWDQPHKFDFRERVSTPLDFSKDSYFSDERLVRRLISENPVPKYEVERGYSHYLDATIDRAAWHIDMEKLKNHGYVNAHGIRPYGMHIEKYAPLIQYIKDNYR